MLLFLRTSDISIDSRLLRYAAALDRAGIRHAAAFWDRGDGAGKELSIQQFRFAHALQYRHRAQTGLWLLWLNLYFVRLLWRERANMSLVHACDLDSAFAAWLASRLTGVPYVYDVYDHYADSRGLEGIWRRLHDWVERIVIRDAALVILADDKRVQQHAAIDPARLLIVENVPALDQRALPDRTPRAARSDRLRIGYLGTFEAQYRGLEDLIRVVEGDPRLELDIAGSGSLHDWIAGVGARCPRVRLHPPLPHDRGMAMMAECDVMAGLYYSAVPNHRFAAPNKYFEHLALGMPLLTSAHTPPGDKVTALDTGWAVADGAAGIAAALDDALTRPGAVADKGRNAAALWRDRYADYHDRVCCGEYVAWVRRLARARRPRGDRA